MTLHLPATPLNIDPLIAETLRRAAQNIAIQKTEQPCPRTQAPPDTTDPVPVPTQPPVSTTVDNAEPVALLGGTLPRIDALIRKAIRDVRSNGRLTVEALALVPEIRNSPSMVIGDVLPPILRPYLTVQAIRVAIDGLQSAMITGCGPGDTMLLSTL